MAGAAPSPAVRYEVAWETPAGRLVLREPTPAEVASHAAQLAAAYNHPVSAALLGHEAPLTEADVVDHYAAIAAQGGHGLLLFREESTGCALAGDGDLRGCTAAGAAEIAILIADPDARGRGLGTRLALMAHALAFGPLGLARVYASVLPANLASRRVFDKLGCAAVDREEVGFGEVGDLVVGIDAATFAARWGALVRAELRFTRR